MKKNLLFGFLLAVSLTTLAEEGSGPRRTGPHAAIQHDLKVGSKIKITVPIELKEKADSKSQTIAQLEPLTEIEVLSGARFEEELKGYISYWYAVKDLKSKKEGFVWRGDLPLIYHKVDKDRAFALVQNSDDRSSATMYFIYKKQMVQDTGKLPSSFIDDKRYAPFTSKYSANFKVKSDKKDVVDITVTFTPEWGDYEPSTQIYSITRESR